MNGKQLEQVKDYYGRVLASKNDLKTTACCSTESVPNYLRPILAKIHPEVVEKFYGCGVPLPSALVGCKVLDLGCGTGRDCFVLSKLVGPSGQVIGVDMTESQLEVAMRHQEYHREAFAMEKSNVDFRLGYIEDLVTAGIEDNSVDLVVSNCVINLSPDKEKVFSEIFRVLKPGGELYFSDVFADRRLPDWMREDSDLLGECLGGAMYIQDFRRLLSKIGCHDYRTMSTTEIFASHDDIVRKIGCARFYSITVRAFKLDLEDRCEDFGQIATYRGNMPEQPNWFRLDDHHLFETGRPLAVCSNTASMLKKTRFAESFAVSGDESTHFGLFDCGPNGGAPAAPSESSLGACC